MRYNFQKSAQNSIKTNQNQSNQNQTNMLLGSGTQLSLSLLMETSKYLYFHKKLILDAISNFLFFFFFFITFFSIQNQIRQLESLVSFSPKCSKSSYESNGLH